MAGTDTSRGINFQYASTIGILVEFANHSNWNIIQMEGDRDIEDVDVFDEQGRIVLRAQIKQKQDPYQWQPAELREVITKLVDCSSCIETTEYRFVYAGSEGKTVAILTSLIEKLRFDGIEALTQSETEQLKDKFENTEILELFSRLGDRLKLVKQDSRNSVEVQNLRKIRKLLVQHGKTPEEDYEETLHNTLFHAIAENSEGKTKYHRRLSREEVFRLLEIEDKQEPKLGFNPLEYEAWLRQKATNIGVIAELNIQPEQAVSEILGFALHIYQYGSSKSDSHSITPWQAVRENRHIVIVGDSGSGKTASIWQLILRYCQLLATSPNEAVVPIFINLAHYNGETLFELIKESFQMAGQFVDMLYIHSLAKEGRLILLFDSFDYVKPEFSSEILSQISHWHQLHTLCNIVVTSQRSSDGSLLAFSTFRLVSLTEEQAEKILREIPDLDRGDFVTIWHAPSQEFKHLVTNPLTLRMLVYAYIHLGKRFPLSRGKLYEEVVGAIITFSENNGHNKFYKSDKMIGLSLLARWMQENKTYSLPLSKLGSLIHEWTEEKVGNLSHLKNCDYASFRQELIQSGVTRLTLDGEIEFVHPTFMAFFVSLTIQVEELPDLVNQYSWHTSLILWCSMHDLQMTEPLIEAAIHNKLLLGQLIIERFDIRTTQNRGVSDDRQYFEQFNRYFQHILSDFSALLQQEPWTKLSAKRLQLYIARNESAGYVVFCNSNKNENIGVEWLLLPDLEKQISKANLSFPLQVTLFPKNLLKKYHPLELVYLWIMRAFFDILYFSSATLSLGYKEKKRNGTSRSSISHPGISEIIRRYVLYQQLASGLPSEITEQLPFYSKKEFDLVIEAHTYLVPEVVCFAFAISRQQDSISIVPSVIETSGNDEALFYKDETNKWVLRKEKIKNLGEVVLVETNNVPDLLSKSPDVWAHNELNSQLTKILAGYPPNLW